MVHAIVPDGLSLSCYDEGNRVYSMQDDQGIEHASEPWLELPPLEPIPNLPR